MRDPGLARSLSAQEAAALVVQTSAIQAVLGARLANGQEMPLGVLTLREAAKMLGIAHTTLRKRLSSPAFRGLLVDNGTRRLAFSPVKIAQFLEGGRDGQG